MDTESPANNVKQLLEQIKKPSLDHQQRAKIGDDLNAIGDPRRGVGLRVDGVPDIDWVKVESGQVIIGKPSEVYDVHAHYIARYPVTVAQYRAFMHADDGYNMRLWWFGLPDRNAEPPQPSTEKNNHPVDSVSWVDAMAFCRWYEQRIKQTAHKDDPIFQMVQNSGWEVRLPTEWEWQQAASGGNPANLFPWGAQRDETRANTAEGNLGRNTAVGMYPHGASGYGVLDMSGNLWEWCYNHFDEPENVQVESNARRALRGGSWFHYMDSATVTARESFTPQHRFNLLGFRMVCSQPPSSFRPAMGQ